MLSVVASKKCGLKIDRASIFLKCVHLTEGEFQKQSVSSSLDITRTLGKRLHTFSIFLMNILSCKNFAVRGDFEYNPPMEYTPTIGLEIHAELATKTKMFCNSKNDPDEKRPNVNICPVCMAHPGTLPVINKDAVRHVIRVGTAMEVLSLILPNLIARTTFILIFQRATRLVNISSIVSGGSLEGVAITGFISRRTLKIST